MKHYIVRAELERVVTASHHDEIADLLAVFEPTITLDANGRTEVQLAMSGHDLWLSILKAMVALTNAHCALTAIHVTQAGECPCSADGEP